MAKEGLGWRHFTSRDVSVVRRNPDRHPDKGRLCNGFVPKLGAGTNGQKRQSVFPLELGKSLTENEPKSRNGVRPNTNARYPKRPILLRWIETIGPTTWSGSPIKGQPSTNASVWENQALFDFDNRAVPVLTECGLVEAKKAPIHLESHFPSKTFVDGLEPIKLTLFVKKSRKRFST